MKEYNMIQRKKQKLRYISVIKGIAIVMIILVHCAQPFYYIPKLLSHLTIYGQMGTQLFFVVSGFLLARHLNDHVNEKYFKYLWVKYRKFATAIVSAAFIYFVTNIICIQFLNSSIYDPRYTIWNIFCNLFLLQQLNPIGVNSVVPGSWYLGCLWAFYLLFPLINKIYRRIYEKPAYFKFIVLLIYEIVVLFLQKCILELSNINVGNNSFFYFSFINQLPSVTIGCHLYYEIQANKNVNFKSSIVFFLLWTIITLVLMYINQPWSFVLCIPTVSFSFRYLIYFIKHLCDSYNKSILNYLSLMGDNSLEIYLVHLVFVWYIPYAIISLMNIQKTVSQTIIFLTVFICVLCIMPSTSRIFSHYMNTIETFEIRILQKLRKKSKRVIKEN